MTTTSPTSARRMRASEAVQLTAVRAGFAVLDPLAPDLAARWALRLWCTLPANKGRRRDERPREGTRSTTVLAGGRRVVVETWGEGEPVYLVHGWGGWRGQLGAFVDPLVAAGRRVVAFDAPSHGDSTPGSLGPGRSTAVELVDALVAVAAAHGAPAGVVAHSLGCTAAALAAQDGLAVGRLALVAPSAAVLTMTHQMADRLGYSARTRTRFDRRLEQLAGRPLRDFDLTHMRGTSPTLVVHDLRDKEVPYADGVAVAEAWSSAELLTTDGLGHQRILRDPDVVARVSAYVTA